MLEEAQAYFIANKAKNAASVKEGKAKKALHKAMVGGEVSKFEFQGRYEGNVTPMVASVESSVVEAADVSLLRGLVSDETFMEIVSATKKAIIDHAGEHVYMNCAKEITKPAALKVQKADK